MGYELTTKDVTTSFSVTDCEEICSRIRQVAAKYKNYGWQSKMLNAKTIADIADIFQIHLIQTNDDRITFELKEVYRSDCFEDILRVIAPFMADGHIEGYSGYGFWKVVFRDKQAYLDYDTTQTVIEYPSDDEIVCETNKL